MSLHGFVIPGCGYFIKFEQFSSPKGGEFDQKIAKNSNAAPLPVHPPPPSSFKHLFLHNNLIGVVFLNNPPLL